MRRSPRLHVSYALLGSLLWLCWPLSAHAHIKWFNPDINLMIPPRDLHTVTTNHSFLILFCATLVVLFSSSLADSYLLSQYRTLRRTLRSVDEWCEARTYAFLRILIGVFFLIIGTEADSILTPETTAPPGWIPYMQYLIGFAAFFPRTGVIAGTGILMLYGVCIERLGLFHMLDYPAFIGAAIYLIWMAMDPDEHTKALTLLRVFTAVTLMVGATEKFGYPNWSFKLLKDYPVLTFGVSDLEFYMAAAGFVEFALAFLVLFGRLSGKAASLLLFLMMASAIILFGWMDAIGHALFLAALLALTFNRNPIGEKIRIKDTQAWILNAAVSTTLFAVFLIGMVYLYREGNIHLVTLCKTTATGIHLHK